MAVSFWRRAVSLFKAIICNVTLWFLGTVALIIAVVSEVKVEWPRDPPPSMLWFDAHDLDHTSAWTTYWVRTLHDLGAVSNPDPALVEGHKAKILSFFQRHVGRHVEWKVYVARMSPDGGTANGFRCVDLTHDENFGCETAFTVITSPDSTPGMGTYDPRKDAQAISCNGVIKEGQYAILHGDVHSFELNFDPHATVSHPYNRTTLDIFLTHCTLSPINK